MVVLEVTGKVSEGSELDEDQVLKDALPNGIDEINNFLQSEGHTLQVELEHFE